jgi:hypothetical protein
MMRTQHIVGGGTILGAVVVLSMIAIGISRHPTSIQGSGISFLWKDFAMLLLYAVAGFVVWNQNRRAMVGAVTVGARFGVFLGVVLIANHTIESFVSVRPFVLIISPVFLALFFLGAAGSAAWERTRSLAFSIVSGVMCAVVGTLIGLAFASCFNLLLENYVETQQHAAFAASGQSDPGGYLVNNILESAAEMLLSMPVFAVVLSFTGATINGLIGRLSRGAAIVASGLAPIMFVAGAYALWHANTLERAARPPFVIAGVLLAGVALCAAHPIWSALRKPASHVLSGSKFVA